MKTNLKGRAMKSRTSLLAVTGLAILALAFTACGGGDDEAEASTSGGTGGGSTAPVDTKVPASIAEGAALPPVEVKVTDTGFVPTEVKIKNGQTVRWVWEGTKLHSVLVSGSNSGPKAGTGTFEKQFTTGPGTYAYTDGSNSVNKGTVIVE